MDLLHKLEEDFGIKEDFVVINSETRLNCLVPTSWIEVNSKNVPEALPSIPDNHYKGVHKSLASLLLSRSTAKQQLDKFVPVIVNIIRKDSRTVESLVEEELCMKNASMEIINARIRSQVDLLQTKAFEKEARDKYPSAYSSENHKNKKITIKNHDTLVVDVIKKLYGRKPVCTEKYVKCVAAESAFCQNDFIIFDGKSTKTADSVGQFVVSHSSLHPVHFVAETSIAYFVFQPFFRHTLADAIAFSPQKLSENSCKMLVFYEMLMAVRHLHSVGININNLRLSDFSVDEMLWVRIVSLDFKNFYRIKSSDSKSPATRREMESLMYSNVPTFPLNIKATLHDLPQIAKGWINGEISNLDYIMVLNKLAGRSFNEPNHHPILPWVLDISNQSRAAFRDLTKSKYRLNKGETQLDLTFDSTNPESMMNHPNPTPFHVSDFLSDITYYVYTSRRNPQDVLCRIVRPRWQPNHYPPNISRLYEWTPDECIPAFYVDQKMFKTCHNDLSDLQLPLWASNPREFIKTHRAALESSEVSQRLHHWIDLTFGFRLSGIAAIESKNVCLQLVDKHNYLMNHGIVQLFTSPHPERRSDVSDSFSSEFPHVLKDNDDDDDDDEKDDAIGFDLENPATRRDNKKRDEDVRIGVKKSLDDPMADLNHLEKFFHFCLKETHLLGDKFMKDECDEINTDDLISSLTSRDMQTLGCLAVELFFGKTMSSLSPDKSSLRERYAMDRSLSFNNFSELPFFIKKCIGYLMNLPPSKQSPLRKSDSEMGAAFTYPAVNSPNDLPPPTIEILLAQQTGVLVFPNYIGPLYNCLSTFHMSEPAFDSPHLVTPRGIFHLVYFLKRFFDVECNRHNVVIYNIVFPYVEFLMSGSLGNEVLISAAWNLFYISSKCCSEAKQSRAMLCHMTNLFRLEETSPAFLKIYHRSFVSQMISIFKLKVFLSHFSTLLVEAVSGFKNFSTAEKDACEHRIVEPEMMQERKIEDIGDKSFGDKHFGDYMKNDEMDKFEREQDLLLLDENEDEYEDTKSIKSGCPSTNSYEEDEFSTKSDATNHPHGDITNPSFDEYSPPSKESPKDSPKVDGELPRDDVVVVCNISDVAKDTAKWLCGKIGPVLTAKYISRNLLRMLVICYIPPHQLDPISPSTSLGFEACATEKYVRGDLNAVEIASCLLHISQTYGEQLILIQYLQHIKELVASVASCKMLTSKREGYIISSITLLLIILRHMNIKSLIDSLQVIEEDVLFPIFHLLSSDEVNFSTVNPSSRSFAAFRLVDIIALISFKLGFEMTRCKIMHIIKKFFDGFQVVEKFFSDGNFQNEVEEDDPETKQPFEVTTHRRQQSLDAIFRDGTDPTQQQEENRELSDLQSGIQKQLNNTYTCELAHYAYVTFCKLAGGICVEHHLDNDDLLRRMCNVYDASTASNEASPSAISDLKSNMPAPSDNSTNEDVTVEGNKIIIKSSLLKQQSNASNKSEPEQQNVDVSLKRTLRGDWLAYWEHEVGFGDRQHALNFKQMKLQTFKGHTSSVKCLKVMDCENSFISAGKDHVVKLWSLRNQGDGSSIVPCQATYSHHKKSIFSLLYIDSLNQVASSDGIVHIWDPFNMTSIRKVVSLKSSPITVLASSPSPSSLLLASSNDSVVRFIDCRLGKFSHYLKTTAIPSGHIKSMSVSDNGYHVAMGFSTGIISTLDIRSGGYISSWKAYDSDILEMKILGNNSILAFSLDLGANVWSFPNGKQLFPMRGMFEGAKWINHSDQTGLVFGYPSNRIAICLPFDGNRQVDLTNIKLKSDLIKGSLSCLSLLPLNHLFLLASDHGDITLVA